MSDYFVPNFSSSLGLALSFSEGQSRSSGSSLLVRVHCCPKGFVLGPNLLVLHLVDVCCLYQRGAEDEGGLACFCTLLWPSLTRRVLRVFQGKWKRLTSLYFIS